MASFFEGKMRFRFVVAALLASTLLITAVAQTDTHNHTNEIQLPVPTGPFAVGRVSYYWTDSSRTEPLSAKPESHREVVVYVWYPAVNNAKATSPAPYFPNFKDARAAISDADFKDLFRPATEQVRKSGLPQTHPTENASLPSDSTRYPVLVFSHGWGLQSPVYTSAFEDLASHGYVVAAIDHAYDTTVTIFPDGHIAKFAQDRFDAATKKPHGFIDYAYERIEVMATDVHFVIDDLSRYNNNPQLGAPFRRASRSQPDWRIWSFAKNITARSNNSLYVVRTSSAINRGIQGRDKPGS